MNRHPMALDPAPESWRRACPEAVILFEHRRMELARSKRLWNYGLALFFLLAFAGSLVAGEVSIEKLLGGLPGIFSYLKDLIPVLRPARGKPPPQP